MSILPLIMTATGTFGAGVTVGALCFSPRVIWRTNDPAARVTTAPAARVTADPAPLMWVTALDPATGQMIPALTPVVPVPHMHPGLSPVHAGPSWPQATPAALTMAPDRAPGAAPSDPREVSQ